MNGKIMGPDEKDGNVDGKDPEHEDQDRMCVIVEVIMGTRSLNSISYLHV